MLQDFAATTAEMAKRGMDVEHPDRGTPIENFYEIGMRQPGRCDLRHGKAMRAMRYMHVSGRYVGRCMVVVCQPTDD